MMRPNRERKGEEGRKVSDHPLYVRLLAYADTFAEEGMATEAAVDRALDLHPELPPVEREALRPELIAEMSEDVTDYTIEKMADSEEEAAEWRRHALRPEELEALGDEYVHGQKRRQASSN
jgi:hypothetical protein